MSAPAPFRNVSCIPLWPPHNVPFRLWHRPEMKINRPLKAADSAIRAYYARLEAYDRQGVLHEGAVSSAFENLLAEYARRRGWVLVPQLGTAGERRIIPDGTVRDENSLPRGYWEAKDSRDDLKAEIAKKIARGYPLGNTIFEDTRQAILYQNKQPSLNADLQSATAVADLLNRFFTYRPPDIAGFEEAVEEFKEHVPDLARGLNEKIKEAHQNNRRFIAAFESFYELCQTALNPNIRREAVDEMLIQHLLTERLIGTIFDKPEFVQQNVIAAEVEKVVTALASQSFSRKDYLKSLDRFYLAIESAARTLPDFTDGFFRDIPSSWRIPTALCTRRSPLWISCARAWPRCWKKSSASRSPARTFTSLTLAPAPATSS